MVASLAGSERARSSASSTPTVGVDHDSNEFLSVTSVGVGDALERAHSEPANDATIEGLLLADHDGLLRTEQER